MTLHNELHFPFFFFFSLALRSERSLYCTGARVLGPFISRKKKRTLVATVWSIKLLKEPPPPPPPSFIRPPERNIKLSVFPSDRRMEISSLSIKMSRYFISVPVGLEDLTLFSVALLHSSLMCSPLSPLPSPSALCLLHRCPRPAPRWVGGSRRRLCTSLGLTGARAPSEVIDFNQWLERLELNDAVDFKRWSAEPLVVGGRKRCRRRHFASEGKSDKHTNRIIERERDLNLPAWSFTVCCWELKDQKHPKSTNDRFYISQQIRFVIDPMIYWMCWLFLWFIKGRKNLKYLVQWTLFINYRAAND